MRRFEDRPAKERAGRDADGRGRIRTCEGQPNRFTVRPFWPLRYTPEFGYLSAMPAAGLGGGSNNIRAERAALQDRVSLSHPQFRRTDSDKATTAANACGRRTPIFWHMIMPIV